MSTAFTALSGKHIKKAFSKEGFFLGRLMGIEPTTSGTTNQRSNHLSYNRRKFRVQNNEYSSSCAKQKQRENRLLIHYL